MEVHTCQQIQEPFVFVQELELGSDTDIAKIRCTGSVCFFEQGHGVVGDLGLVDPRYVAHQDPQLGGCIEIDRIDTAGPRIYTDRESRAAEARAERNRSNRRDRSALIQDYQERRLNTFVSGGFSEDEARRVMDDVFDRIRAAGRRVGDDHMVAGWVQEMLLDAGRAVLARE